MRQRYRPAAAAAPLPYAVFHPTPDPPPTAPPRSYMPYDAATGEVDTASVSADGSVYTNPKYMTVIVTGASGDIEHDDAYTKQSPSFTGTENCEWLCARARRGSRGSAGRAPQSSCSPARARSLSRTRPPARADGWGYFQAVNASVATWNFHTVQPDGNGVSRRLYLSCAAPSVHHVSARSLTHPLPPLPPTLPQPKDYSDSLTIVQNNHREARF